MEDSSATPQSPESLYGRLKSAKSESSGFGGFMKAAFIILLGTVGCFVLLVVFMAIPIAMIAIGAYYLHDCPAERYIPIYLVVGGSFGLLRMFISLGQKIRKSDEDQEQLVNPWFSFLDCFEFAWVITGSVWIYRAYGKLNETDLTAENYCNPTLYYFAFWLTTSGYILIGIILVCICCFSIFSIAFSTDE